MFSMEEVEGSAKRPPVQGSAPVQRTSSISDDDDDDDTDHFIRPILDESSTKDICHYLKNLVNDRQLSNSLPKSSFTYQVGTPCKNSAEPWPLFNGCHVAFCRDLCFSVRTAVCLIRRTTLTLQHDV